MIPIKLELQCFGPFLNKTVCDFTSLSSRMFIISGATGSGKTSILDAISIALYNMSTFNDRKLNDLRSLNSDKKTETYVSYEFKLNNTTYKCVRTFRPRQKSNLSTAAIYKLVECEYELITNKEFKTYIEELIGLTHEQFCQVMILPQGKFAQLLNESHGDKLNIFKVLFNTDKWINLELKLKLEEKILSDLYYKHFNAITEKLNNLGCKDEDELNNSINLHRDEIASLNISLTKQALEITEKNKLIIEKNNINEKFLELNKLKLEMNQLELKSADMKIKATILNKLIKLQKLYPKYIELNNIISQIKNIDNKLEKSNTSIKNNNIFLNELYAKKDFVGKLETELEINKNNLANYRINHKIFEEVNKSEVKNNLLKIEMQEYEVKYDNCACDITEINKKIEVGTQHLEELSKKELSLGNLSLEYEHAMQFNVINKNLTDSLNEKQDNIKKISTENKILEKLLNDIELTKQNIIELAKLDKKNAAYNLFIDLKDGDHCPVCNNKLEHLSSLHFEDTTDVTDDLALNYLKIEELNSQKLEQKIKISELEHAINIAEININKCNDNLAKLKKYSFTAASADYLQGIIDGINIELNDKDIIISKIKLLNQELLEKNNFLSQILLKLNETKIIIAKNEEIILNNERIFDKEILKINISELNEKISDKQEQINIYNQNYNDTTNIIKNENCILEELSAEKTELQGNLRKTQVEYNNLDTENKSFDIIFYTENIDELENLRDQIAKYNNECSITKNNIKIIQVFLENKFMSNIILMTKELEDLKLIHEEANRTIGAKLQILEQLNKASSEIKLISASLQKIETDYSILKRLKDYINGDNFKKMKLSDFVLRIMLEEVATNACRYMYDFSSGRYELRLTGTDNSKRSEAIDFEVVDNYSATGENIRKVCTLSGGEGFLASLALAFSLAEIVQNNSGNVHIDTIFIDEGFGTLDTETLDIALKALSKIEQSGRYVGLISHLNEVKERIYSRINIEYDKNILSSNITIQ